MYKDKSHDEYLPIVHFVPGYAFYRDMGSGLAESLVNLFEFIAATFTPGKR